MAARDLHWLSLGRRHLAVSAVTCVLPSLVAYCLIHNDELRKLQFFLFVVSIRGLPHNLQSTGVLLSIFINGL